MIGLHRFHNHRKRIACDNILIRGPAAFRRAITVGNLRRQLDLEIRKSFEMQNLAEPCNRSRADTALFCQLCDAHMDYFSGRGQNPFRQLALHL
ncbi:hypothetical protein D3C75_1137500 [compost metagenome]